MVYGKGNTFDVDRLIELLEAFETFVDIRDSDPIGPAKDAQSTTTLAPAAAQPSLAGGAAGASLLPGGNSARPGGLVQVSGRRARRRAGGGAAGGGAAAMGAGMGGGMGWGIGGAGSAQGRGQVSGASQALLFLFGDEGELLREFILTETVNSVDAMSRGAVLELARRLALPRPPAFAQALLPPLSPDDEKLVTNAQKLVDFLGANRQGGGPSAVGTGLDAKTLQELAPILPEIAPGMQRFGRQILGGLVERLNSRMFSALRLQLEPLRGDYFRD